MPSRGLVGYRLFNAGHDRTLAASSLDMEIRALSASSKDNGLDEEGKNVGVLAKLFGEFRGKVVRLQNARHTFDPQPVLAQVSLRHAAHALVEMNHIDPARFRVIMFDDRVLIWNLRSARLRLVEADGYGRFRHQECVELGSRTGREFK